MSVLMALSYILVARNERWPVERNSSVAIEAVKPSVVAIGPPMAIEIISIIRIISREYSIYPASLFYVFVAVREKRQDYEEHGDKHQNTA